MSTAPIISDLQKINPSAIIELFTLQTVAAIHGSTQTYRFHNGSNLNNSGDVIWAGNQYLKMPIQAEGFAFQKGQLPRPTLTISNALGTITAILLNVNSVTTGNDLTGATVTRIRTLARYLDAVNFPGGTNPLGTPDPTAEFPQEIYKIDRKASETREAVQFELAAPTDLAGIRIPGRQCTRSEFPSIGTFIV
jgi:lambda family phage minor tail protein L